MAASSSSSRMELPVFTDTNLGTHLAMSASPDITAGDLKRKLRREHYLCFPQLGEIKVHALMVKCKSCFYHIPDSVPIKGLFKGFKDAWFLRLDVTRMEYKHNQAPLFTAIVAEEGKDPGKTDLPSPGETQQQAGKGSTLERESSRLAPKTPSLSEHGTLHVKDIAKRQRDQYKCLEDPQEENSIPIHSLKRRRKSKLKKKCKLKDTVGGYRITEMGAHEFIPGYSNESSTCREHVPEEMHQGKLHSNDGKDDTSQSMSDVISVTGIITRYFPESDEVSTFNEHAESRGNIVQCPKQTKVEGTKEIADGFIPLMTSDVQDHGSKVTSVKKFARFEIPASTGTSVSSFNEKGRSATSHCYVDEHQPSQGDRDELSKANNICHPVAKFPPIKFSLAFSAPSTVTPKSNLKRNEVGKRLLFASNGFGISTSMQKAQISTCFSALTKSSLLESTAIGRSIVFEIGDGDD